MAILLPVHAIGAGHRALGLVIGQEREAQRPLFGESPVRPAAIHRDAEQHGVEALELRQHLVVQGHLVAAAGAEIGRIV